MVFIWGDRGYSAVRFEYKTASERYLVAEIWAKQFWVFLNKFKTLFLSKNTQKQYFENIEKTPNFGRMVRTLEIEKHYF